MPDSRPLKLNISPADYKGYRNLPPLVGLHTMQDAIDIGLTIEASVKRLKYHHWVLRRLHQVFIHRLTAMPIYELKMAFSLHGHLCAEHVLGMHARVREMREPPYGLDKSPHAALDLLFDEILSAPSIEALVLGLYEKIVPGLVAGLQQHIDDTNHLFDHPTFRVCRMAHLELQDVEVYGKEAIDCLVDDAARAELKDWLAMLDQCINLAGGLDSTRGSSDAALPTAQFSAEAYVYDGTPKRDERFIDSYNMGVSPEAMLFDPAVPAKPKTIMMYFKRLREIDVPEMMASILAETPDKPWEYTRDMTRQLWDEARHAMMGEIGFVDMGIDWTKIPINFTWSLELNSQLKPHERHAILFTIEQGLMPAKTGKQLEWEVAVAASDDLAQKIQDYDWADEILHARIGRDWFVSDFGTQKEALAFGSACWSRALGGWQAYLNQGKTEHRNWWPEVYTQACENWGIQVDPKVLSFSTTYEEIRPDMQEVK